MAQIPSLQADCQKCAALCCVAFSFVEDQGFGRDKEADVACPNLSGHRCKIYEHRSARGWGACDHYDCNGAGPYVTQTLFAGQSWEDKPELKAEMCSTMRDIRPIFDDLKLVQLAEAKRPHGAYDALRRQLWPKDWTRDALAGASIQQISSRVREKLRDILSEVTSD